MAPLALLVMVPPVTVALFSVSVPVPSTVMVPPPLATVVPRSSQQCATGQNFQRIVGGDDFIIQRVADAADIDGAGIAEIAVLEHASAGEIELAAALLVTVPPLIVAPFSVSVAPESIAIVPALATLTGTLSVPPETSIVPDQNS